MKQKTTIKKLNNKNIIEIDQELLDQLGIVINTQLVITTDGTTIMIAPVKDDAKKGTSEKEFEVIVDEVTKAYGPVLKKLADS
ncbi:MAG: hypothetical protein H6679_00490 [Epsilonproteobacteria bacterium]|nr:hypothetical protein [Campylobacterota bacterium]